MDKRIALTVNDEQVNSPEHCTVAAVLLASPGVATRVSVTGEPRGPLCGMGVCFECRVTIDGEAHQRSCQISTSDGIVVATRGNDSYPREHEQYLSEEIVNKAYDVLVIGAGPAGIATAVTAAQAGQRVAVLSDDPHIGGQIWRHDHAKPLGRFAADWRDRLSRSSAEWIASASVFASPKPGVLLAETPTGPMRIRADQIVLACGARERFVPFPGWTLPGVFGAGGLQALVKAGMPIAGQRVIVAGTGPLLLAVADYLRSRGANVRLIAEQTSRGKLARFAGGLLLREPAKIAEAAGFAWRLRGIPFRPNCWPTSADGEGHLQSVTLTDGSRRWTEPCDALACGFGLVANTELPCLLGCAIEHGFVRVDADQRTSVPNVFAIGELAGIGGLDKALLEGEIAGHVVAGRHDLAAALQRRRAKARGFVDRLADTFALRDDLRQLPDAKTIVCRCEDVTFEQLRTQPDIRTAKLHTRIGMGPCQGRICGSAAEFLFGWDAGSVRSPIFPVAMKSLAGGE